MALQGLVAAFLRMELEAHREGKSGFHVGKKKYLQQGPGCLLGAASTHTGVGVSVLTITGGRSTEYTDGRRRAPSTIGKILMVPKATEKF